MTINQVFAGIAVADLEVYFAELGKRGLATGAIDTVPGLYRKAVITDAEILRCAQHDRADLSPRHRHPLSPLRSIRPLCMASVDAYEGRYIGIYRWTE